MGAWLDSRTHHKLLVLGAARSLTDTHGSLDHERDIVAGITDVVGGREAALTVNYRNGHKLVQRV